MFEMDIVAYEKGMIFIVLGIAFVALGYAYWLRNYIMAADKGTAEMQRHWGHIRDGANAYLRTQLRTIAVMIVLLTVAMFLSVFVVSPRPKPTNILMVTKTGRVSSLRLRARWRLSWARRSRRWSASSA